MRASSLGLLALAAALAAPMAPWAAPAEPAEVAAAERAFAADAPALGIGGSFVKHSTPEAIVFAPTPRKAHEVYGGHPPPGPDAKPLVWWPLWAGIARSGDLGFTTGPATYDGKPSGWYFTVWARQADGGWKWIYDGGVPAAHGAAPGPDAPTAYLAPASGPDAAPAQAMAQVQAAEAKLAAAAATDLTAAYAPWLAPEARVQGSAEPPAATPETVTAELARRAPAIAFAPLGGSASAAGDLAWTYGEARWDGGSGHYVRIWRSDAGGWRLVFDQILTTPST